MLFITEDFAASMCAAASWSSADDVIFFASSEERPSTLRLATEPTAQPAATRPAIGFFGAIFIAVAPAPAKRPATTANLDGQDIGL